MARFAQPRDVVDVLEGHRTARCGQTEHLSQQCLALWHVDQHKSFMDEVERLSFKPTVEGVGLDDAHVSKSETLNLVSGKLDKASLSLEPNYLPARAHFLGQQRQDAD